MLTYFLIIYFDCLCADKLAPVHLIMYTTFFANSALTGGPTCQIRDQFAISVNCKQFQKMS
jgi:hypothetical protein